MYHSMANFSQMFDYITFGLTIFSFLCFAGAGIFYGLRRNTTAPSNAHIAIYALLTTGAIPFLALLLVCWPYLWASAMFRIFVSLLLLGAVIVCLSAIYKLTKWAVTFEHGGLNRLKVIIGIISFVALAAAIICMASLAYSTLGNPALWHGVLVETHASV